MLLQSFTVTADVEPPVDRYDVWSMEMVVENPMNPEEKAEWKSFKQVVANTGPIEFIHSGLMMRFALDGNGYLRCDVPMNCTALMYEMFSWVRVTKKQGTVKSVETLVTEFLIQKLVDLL